MRFSLTLGARRPLSRQTAWGFFTTNLALPGSGSLLAGRISGYPQLALALGGMAMTLIFGARFVGWAVLNLRRLGEQPGDPIGTLVEVWLAVRWALLGMGMFVIAWLWALVTGWLIVHEAKTAEPAGAPPRLTSKRPAGESGTPQASS